MRLSRNQFAVAHRALTILQEPGSWRQGKTFSCRSDGTITQRTLMGAVIEAATNAGRNPALLRPLLKSHLQMDPTVWNEAKGRTRQEVVAALQDFTSTHRWKDL